MRSWMAALRRMLWVGLMVPAVAGATEEFDFVVASHVRINAYVDPAVAGVVSCFSCALVVNTGAVPITGWEINTAQVSGALTSGVMPWGPYACLMRSSSAEIADDLQPEEAIGFVSVYNDALLDLLKPSEAFRNTPVGTGWQFTCSVGVPQGFEGTSHYDVAVLLGGREVRFPLQVDVVLVPRGQQGKEILEVSRVTSSSTVAVLPTTWGALKALYR